MTRTARRAGALAMGVVLSLGLALPAQSAEARPEKARLVVRVFTPGNVPANVVIGGHRRAVVAKALGGTRLSRTLALPAGRYSVAAPAVTYRGRLYSGKVSKRRVTLARGKRAVVTIRYRAVRSASALHTTAVSPTAIRLTWASPKGAKFVLRRAIGSRAPTGRRSGAAVALRGRSALNRGLRAGQTYSYSLFTRVGRTWTGPLKLTVGTTPPAGSNKAAFVAAPSTVLNPPIVAARPGATTVVVLRSGVVAPVIGATVVLPQSKFLPGGYLGKVVGVAADGRTVAMTPAPLSDAFSFYQLSAAPLTTTPRELTPSRATARHASGRRVAAAKSCLGGSASGSVNFKPSIGLDGFFSVKIDTFNVLGANIPKGAAFNAEIAVTAAGAADVETTGSLSCGLSFPKVTKQITLSPVPIALAFSPTAEFYAEGTTKTTNLGVKVRAGVHFSGSLGIGKNASFSGYPVLSSEASTPKTSSSLSVGARLSGELLLGPGAATDKVGAVAGIAGVLTPIDAKWSAQSPSCTSLDLSWSRELNLTAKAWVGGWSASQSVTIDALKGSSHYPGFPRSLPQGCDAPPAPGNDLFGPGVAGKDESTTGSPSQVGHVDGFVPNKQAWVLSTGNISDVTGPPDQFASTELGLSGDDTLSERAGHETYDAVTYTASVVPSGNTLHVRYVFASEEYPEYVGSEYNDIMRVTVDGQDCSYVPGTSDPVSVNTVNGDTNSQYFVDNSTVAPGYNTTMDGLTVPLTCSVPVTPGKKVTVRIALADTSDGAYDSAVALVDGGIYSD